MMSTRYEALFDRLSADGEGALIPFTMLGDPGGQASLEVIDALVAGGADALELGIPFSDPIADGPTIQAAALRALGAGTRPADCWALLAQVRARHPDIPIGLLVYANLVVTHGLDAFYSAAAEAGVDSALVADVPTREAAPFAAAAQRRGVAPVLIAPPNADAACLAAVARGSRGYTYVVTRRGVTGADDDVELESARLLARLREHGAPPCVFGFGVARPEHVRRALAAGAAGVISGSAVVDHIPRHDAPAARAAALTAFVRSMKAATRQGG